MLKHCLKPFNRPLSEIFGISFDEMRGQDYLLLALCRSMIEIANDEYVGAAMAGTKLYLLSHQTSLLDSIEDIRGTRLIKKNVHPSVYSRRYSVVLSARRDHCDNGPRLAIVSSSPSSSSTVASSQTKSFPPL